MNKPKDYGFREDLVVIEPEAYFAGVNSKLPDIIHRPDGQWPLVEYEPQASVYETSGCTVYGTQSQIEMFIKELWGVEENYNERFTYLMAGVTINGANPQDVYESIRNQGVIDDEPDPPTYAEFNDKKYLTTERKTRAKTWVTSEYELIHDYLSDTSKKSIKENLIFSPIALSVSAWYLEDGLYVDKGQPNNHWCVAFGYIDDPRGIILRVLDTYDNSVKMLHPNHRIAFAKRISLRKLTAEDQKKTLTLLQQILQLLLQVLGLQKELEKAPTPVLEEKPEPSTVHEEHQKLLWDTPANARHSVRVIGDEEGLTWKDKDIVCAVIQAESGFKNTAVNYNRNTKGEVISTDWGICQINDYWHVKKGKTFPSVEYIVENPEKAVRWMIAMYQAGKINLWSAYVNGSYKKYLV